MSDLLHQNIATVQSLQQPAPVTLASAATIAPTTFLTVITGVVAIANIIPPVTGTHMLAFRAVAALPAFLLTGNIAVAGAVSTAGSTFFVIYDPTAGKYYPVAKA